jgi:uncharacterized cupin superfamily protein
MPSDRSFKADLIQRDQATPETRALVSSWTKWEASAGAPFEIHYDRAVSFCVMDGRAEIAFTNGTQLNVQKDDFVTIKPDIKGVWTVIEPITNLYRYHDVGPDAP